MRTAQQHALLELAGILEENEKRDGNSCTIKNMVEDFHYDVDLRGNTGPMKEEMSVGEKNNSLDDASKAQVNTFNDIIPDHPEDREEESKEPPCDEAKEAISCLKKHLDDCIEPQLKEYEDDNSGENRGKYEFYLKVKECAEHLINLLQSNGEVGYREAGVYLNSLMSPIQVELPRELWGHLTIKPFSIANRFRQIEIEKKSGIKPE